MASLRASRTVTSLVPLGVANDLVHMGDGEADLGEKVKDWRDIEGRADETKREAGRRRRMDDMVEERDEGEEEL
jgi:hypothetical protein